jgi:acetylornithine/N-succinyldiaminopimelate aminotransferase
MTTNKAENAERRTTESFRGCPASRRAPNAEHRSQKNVRDTFEHFVVPSYARFEIVLERGKGSYVWDIQGRRYLDLGGGIAVCALGHANPEITKALTEQSKKLIHVSNLYYNELQGRLAKRIANFIAPGRVFFCNSGAEANEGLFKLARKFGHAEGRYEIITTFESFHGRTLAGIAATGQEKVKKGFGPAVAGFKHVPFNDLDAMHGAITPQTAAILIEPIQGESGITVATPEYLRGLRRLCDEHNLLLLFDEVQAGHFRTGKFQSWQRIVASASLRARFRPVGPPGRKGGSALEAGRFSEKSHRQHADATFLPDAVSMAKSLGGGLPIGAFWVCEEFAGLLSAGTHASTFGGTPLACAVALKILDVIQRDKLAKNAHRMGDFLFGKLRGLQRKHPSVIREVRGFGLMIGIDFDPNLPAFKRSEKSPAIQVVNRLHEKGVLTVPAANSVIRLLPALNLSRREAEEGLTGIRHVVEELKS